MSGKILESTSKGSLQPFYDADRANTAFLVVSSPVGSASILHPANSAPSVAAFLATIYTAGSALSVIAAGITPSVIMPSTGSYLTETSLFAVTVRSPSGVSFSSAAVYSTAEISIPHPNLTSQPTTSQQKNVQGGSKKKFLNYLVHTVALISAANQSSLINADTLLFRNSASDKQLRDEHLISADVIDDGNCLLRPLSVNMYNFEKNYIDLLTQSLVIWPAN